MQRHKIRRSRRAQANQASVREVDISLPLRGLFIPAKAAKVSGLYAAELENLISNGLKLTSRPGISWQGDAEPVLQRIPFEFGAASDYIELRPSSATYGTKTFSRIFAGKTMAASLSSNVLLADGYGMPIRFNGTDFATADFVSDVGENVGRFDGVLAHHDRAYFWRTDGPLEFHYGDVGALSGELTRFPLDRLGNITGNMVMAASLTIDAGHGMNDVLAILTSTGQIVAFEGLDPGDADDWRLLGRVKAAPPISRQSFVQVGSDLWILTPRGVISVGESMRASTLALVSDVSRPVADLISEMIAEGPADWQMILAEDGSSIIANRVRNNAARQVVYTPQSRAWSTSDMPVRMFHNLAGSLECTGLDGRLGRFNKDGTSEVLTVRWESSWFNAGREASIHYIKPIIRAKGAVSARVWILSDFNASASDMAEAEQDIILYPQEDDDGIITIADEIGIDATGSAFQVIIEVQATWMEIVSLTAAIG